jgi:hypothetical protein
MIAIKLSSSSITRAKAELSLFAISGALILSLTHPRFEVGWDRGDIKL